MNCYTARARRTYLVAITIGASLACGGSAPDSSLRNVGLADALKLPTETPHVVGIITTVQAGDSVRRSSSDTLSDQPVSCPPQCVGSGTPLRYVVVEEVPGEQRGNKARATVLVGAKLYVSVAGELRSSSFAELRTGQHVSLWLHGPVAESYPVQGTVGTLLLRQ